MLPIFSHLSLRGMGNVGFMLTDQVVWKVHEKGGSHLSYGCHCPGLRSCALIIQSLTTYFLHLWVGEELKEKDGNRASTT